MSPTEHRSQEEEEEEEEEDNCLQIAITKTMDNVKMLKLV
jgi:hypothetical protein